MNVGPNFKRTITLESGQKLSVRPIRPSDREALHAFFHALSPETRYRRFMGHCAELSPAMLTYLTEIDGDNHIAVVAFATTTFSGVRRSLRGGLKRRPKPMLAVARVVRLPEDPKMAEVALTIADHLQGQGVGTALLSILVEAAAERGVDEIGAHVLDDNVRMKRILAKNGSLRRRSDGMVAVRVARPKQASALERALAWATRGEDARRELARRFLRWPRRAA